ncbi:MAG: endolytic transglycosylase MltG [Oligoflexia bacterium]|nr:endolytic transglycosylase MltG [Oligoflexia bacterium]
MASGIRPQRAIVGLIFLFVVLGLTGASARLAMFALSPLRQIPADGIIIEVFKGQSPKDISRLLVKDGAIAPENERLFRILGRVGRYWRRVKAGEYRITQNNTPVQIFSALVSGISIIHPVTVREGENMYEIAKAVAAEGLGQEEAFLKLCHDPKITASFGLEPEVKSVEGYLFPDTYYFNKTMSLEDMLHQMHREFSSAWTAELAARAKAIGFTRHQTITLASIIEKETGAASERPMISSVFHNRLTAHMRLQSDPTTIYGMWDRFTGKIHKTDLLADSPYNTYTIPGLPIGPISNPGRESIRAALYPAQSDYLFFVSHNDGTHQFSHSYEDHQNAVRKFQLDPAAREGKSWRDLAPAESKRESAHPKSISN